MKQTLTSAPTGVLTGTHANKVLKNTYMLLSMTLAFSALCSGISMVMNLPPLSPLITIVGYFGLLFLVHKTADSAMGLLSVFALTGFMGFTLGPIISMYMANGGASIVTTALGGTAAVFIGLSGYALATKKDFSFLSGFIVVGAIVLLLAMVASFFFNFSGFQLALSAAFILFSSAIILYQTSEIIHGGETNYIRATVTLYVSIYNIFLSLLHLLSAFDD